MWLFVLWIFLVDNAALWKNHHGKGRKWLVRHKIYINNNKIYSYKAGLISPPCLQQHTKLVLQNKPDKQCTVDLEKNIVFNANIFRVQNHCV